MATGRQRSVRGQGRDAELSTLEYAAVIAVLLAVAAFTLLSGCSDEKLHGVSGAVEVSSARIDFGLVAIGSTATREVTVRNVGSAPLHLADLAPDGELAAAFPLPRLPAEELPVGGRVVLALRFEPMEAGYAGAALLLRTDVPGDPPIRLLLRGDAGSPAVSATEALDFGRVVLNRESVLPLRLFNGGRVPATVRLEHVEGEDRGFYSVSSGLVDDAVTVPADQSVTLDVRFLAARLGPITDARLRLTVDGVGGDGLAVALAGEGFASDLTVTPYLLDFGAVSPGAFALRTVQLDNRGNSAIALTTLPGTGGSDTFSVTAVSVNGVPGRFDSLPPGGSAVVEVRFAPTLLGVHAGELRIDSGDAMNPRIVVPLTGRGGGAHLLVTPAVLDFGVIAPGMLEERPVHVANVGTAQSELRITRVEFRGDSAFGPAPVVFPIVLELGSAPAELAVQFQPLVEGIFEGSLTIITDDPDEPSLTVPLKGETRLLPPCSFVAEPAALSFGAVPVGATSILVVALRNQGTADCLFSTVALARGAPAAFALPQGPIPMATVRPGESLRVPVSVTPSVPGRLSANLGFYVSDPLAPSGRVQLLADAVAGCLTAQPSALELGTQRVSCPPVSRLVTLHNGCAGQAVVRSVSLGAGSSSPGELVELFSGPVTLAPGGSATVEVRYDPVDDGDDAAPLLLDADILAQPLTVAVHGAGTLSDQRTDSFTQYDQQAVDVLFVVDNSGSMMEEQQAIGAAFNDFITYALSQNVDYHLGVTTTGITVSGGGWATCPGGVDGGEAGRLFPATGGAGRYIDPATPDAAAVFATNVEVGVCHWWEEGLEAAYLALESPLVDSSDDPATALADDGNLGFYRPEARLSVIIVTDEDDHSSRDPSFYTGFFRGLKGPGREDRVQVHGVLGTGCSTASGDGVRYGEVIAATGGVTETICTSDWGRSLATLAEAIFRYRLSFPLTGTPEGAISVAVDGRPLRSGFVYDSGENAVIFDEAAAPGPGETVTVTYVPACGS